MAAKTELDPKVIEAAKTLQHTPWCDEYQKMISGMMYVHYYSAVVSVSLELGVMN